MCQLDFLDEYMDTGMELSLDMQEIMHRYNNVNI